MKAISTKYLPATNTKGSRIKAYDCDNNSVTLPMDYRYSGEILHRKAAEALRDKMNWAGELIGGGTKDGYVFVFKS